MSALRRWFAYEELEGDVRLRLVCAALLLFFCRSLGAWHLSHAAMLSSWGIETWNTLPSWLVASLAGPVFPPPVLEPVYLALLYFCGLLGLSYLFRKDCFPSMLVLAFLFLNKTFFYLSDLRLATDYDHIHLFLTLLFLVSRRKRFFFRAGVAASYLCLALAKLNPSWLRAEYFLSIRGTLRALPSDPVALRWLCPAWVAWEALGPWLWFSGRKAARDAALAVFALAHAWSAVAGPPDFAFLMLPVLLSAFWGAASPPQADYRFERSHVPAWALLALLAAGNLWHFLVPGDTRLSGEGRLWALPQMEVNRAGSCRVVIYNGERRTEFEVSWPWRLPTRLDDGSSAPAGVPQYRGRSFAGGKLQTELSWRTVVRVGGRVLWNPYPFLSLPNRNLEPWVLYRYASRVCREHHPDRVSVRLDLQLDGHAAARVVDVDDFCAAAPSYRPWGRNRWIALAGPSKD